MRRSFHLVQWPALLCLSTTFLAVTVCSLGCSDSQTAIENDSTTDMAVSDSSRGFVNHDGPNFEYEVVAQNPDGSTDVKLCIHETKQVIDRRESADGRVQVFTVNVPEICVRNVRISPGIDPNETLNRQPMQAICAAYGIRVRTAGKSDAGDWIMEVSYPQAESRQKEVTYKVDGETKSKLVNYTASTGMTTQIEVPPGIDAYRFVYERLKNQVYVPMPS